MSVIATYGWSSIPDNTSHTLKLEDNFYCSENEEYINRIEQGIAYYSFSLLGTLSWAIGNEGGSDRCVLYNPPSSSAGANYIRRAFYLRGEEQEYASGIIRYIDNVYRADFVNTNFSFDWDVYSQEQQFPYYTGSRNEVIVLATNIPIFDTAEHAAAYKECKINDKDLAVSLLRQYCINFKSEPAYDGDKTKYYWIYNQRGLADCVRNTATPTGAQTWLSLKFQCNDIPVLYFGSDYTLILKASGVVSSFSLDAPGYILDHVPESSWVDGLVTDGPFYGNIPTRLQATGEPLADGEYMYGFALNTNVYIFENEDAANDAILNDDFSKAVNFESITGGNTYLPPDFGDEEQNTTFGMGGGESLFSTMHIFTTSQLRTFATKVFDDSTSVIDAILNGLKLYGAEPIDVIGNLKYFPFDLSRVCNASGGYDYIYFGSYKMENVPHMRVINMSGGGYIDAGTIFLRSLFNSYRDFEPYTQLHIYLPYIGWQSVDIGEIINKNVNIRYYIDIITGRCTAVMLADGVLIDYWNGVICADMMITATDARSYSAAALSSIGNGISKPITGATKGVELGSSAGPYGAAAGGVIGGGLGLITGGLGTAFELEKLGLPKDHIKQSGSNTGLIGMNMPQYVIWRYDIHEALEPNSFNDFFGRPSTASGAVSSFSGYLSCKQVRLNSTGMTEEEANEVLALLKSGIYI